MQQKASFPQQYANFLIEKVREIDAMPNRKETDKSVVTLKKAIGNAISLEDYSQAIMLLMERMDLHQRIHWHCCQNPYTSREVLIRDARHAIAPSRKPEAYIIMGINYLRSIKALLSSKQYEAIRRYFFYMVCHFYIKMIDLIEEEKIEEAFRHFNTVLIVNVASLLNIPFETAFKRVCVAKDFANLEDASRDIVTLLNLKEGENQITFFQADLPLTQFTKNIIEEYNAYKQKKWYQGLPPWQQALIDHYMPLILTGNKVLPTQLRTVPLVGLRNTYQAIYGVFSPAMDKATVTTIAFHSGTLIALGKDPQENERLSLLQGEQLSAFMQADKIFLLTLNSDLNPMGNDQRIVDGTRQLAQKKGFYHINLPLNALRKFSTNDYTGINDLLALVAEYALADFKKLIDESLDLETKSKMEVFFDGMSKYLLNRGKNFPLGETQAFMRYLTTLGDLRTQMMDKNPSQEKMQQIDFLIEVLELSFNLCFLTHNNKSIIDADNQNLVLACYVNLLISLLQPYLNIAINSSCESGKDRDGLLMFRTALVSFNKVLLGTYSLFVEDEAIQQCIHDNILALSIARHQQFLAGCQGGGIGNFGIKKDSQAAIPKNEFPLAATGYLIEKTASYNKKIPILKDPSHCIFYPLGNTDVSIQRFTIIHVLKLQESLLNAFLLDKQKLTATAKLSALFKNPDIKASTSLLSQTITHLKSAKTLADLASIIDAAAKENRQLTAMTPYSVGETYKLLQAIYTNLSYIMEKIKAYQTRANLEAEKNGQLTLNLRSTY